MKINYNNWSTKIFEGFYESNLYNSDSLYWITQTDREEGYLKDNFTSYDGFISFIENNICTFKEQYKTDKNKCLNVMIEYYLLTCIYDTFNLSNIDNYYETIYHNNLYETARECIYEHIYKTKVAA